ncbi:LCP family protein [Microterricola viridarii]|uniref:Cell envelope-related function transcriptional attenuator common domain-containing protein n=1 Tax=Microterricola viridarii TaxID=412690 RepID=A0A1H1YG80_9MICO|nr:LCP family protein [Microterricola viridarii]SDT20381.1 cell envelope-related function transcriptional attenuator common domain-containing protein [Microterricola viridarii]
MSETVGDDVAQAAPGRPVRHGRQRPQSPGRELVKFTASALAILLIASAAVGAYAVFDTLNQVKSNAVDISLPGSTPPPPPPGIGAIEGGFNMLIVGTDNDANQGDAFGVRDATLNDVNILLHVSADHQNAVALTLPRDLVIPQPECTNPDTGETFGETSAEPLNDAYERGGLACIVNTVSSVTGIDIGYAGLVSFNGVIALSDAVGGVPVCLAAPLVDPGANLDLPAGESVISGATALAFLRTRYSIGDRSDLSRISNQQSFMASLLRTVRSDSTLNNPAKLYSLARVAADHMTFSTSLAEPAAMIALALSLKDIPLDNVVFVQFPVVDSTDFSGKVQPEQPLADELMSMIANDQAFSLAPDSVGNGVELQGGGETPTAEPSAPADPSATANPTDPAATGAPVVPGLTGQTGAQSTCSKAFPGE